MTATIKDSHDQGKMRFWYVVSAVVGALALLKGIRLPNRWSATQAQLDYSQGFVKRGFFGAAIAGPMGLGHYARFAVVSYVLLAALAVLVIVLAVKSGLVKRLGGAEMLAVFCGCYGVSTIANAVGYMDVPLGILAVCVLFVRNAWARFVVGLVLTAVGLLVHELFLFVFVPVVVLSFVVQGMKEKRRGVVVAGLVLALAAGVVGWKLAHERPMTGAQAATMGQHIAQRVDFEPRQDFYTVLVLSSADNQRIMNTYFHIFDWYVKQAASVVVFGPSLVLLLAAMVKVLRGAAVEAWLMGVAVVCALSPLAMHLFAWDVGRFNGLACLTAFLALIVAVKFTDGPALVSTVRQQRMVAGVLLLSMASGGLLMWREDKVFPAYSQLKKFKNQMHEMTLAQIADLSD
jgi:hypothetical protein